MRRLPLPEGLFYGYDLRYNFALAFSYTWACSFKRISGEGVEPSVSGV